jgi:hypothetical protein
VGTVRRVTAAPYAQNSLSAIQEEIAVVHLGVADWTNGLSSERQASILRNIDDAVDIITEELDYEPWWITAQAITLSSGTSKYGCNADLARIVVVTETIGGKTREVPLLDEHVYREEWGQGTLRTTHPREASGAAPFLLFLGPSDDDPPNWILERRPVPGSDEDGGTMTVYYRPVNEQFTSSRYPTMPAAGRRAVLHYVKAIIAADRGDEAMEKMQTRHFEREVIRLKSSAKKVHEQGGVLALPGDFVEEIMEP